MILTLDLLPDRLAVCWLPADAPWPVITTGAFVSIARTPDELSLVCDEAAAPAGARVERGWRALRVRGPLAFEAIGVIASLSAPLAAASVPIFVISTFETDYVLVKAESVDRAIGALRSAGHQIEGSVRRE